MIRTSKLIYTIQKKMSLKKKYLLQMKSWKKILKISIKTTQDILDNKFPKIPYNHNICGIW